MANRFAQTKLALEDREENETVQPQAVQPVAQTAFKINIEPKAEDLPADELKSAQNAKKKQRKGFDYNKSIPKLKKNLQLPAELDLAIKELKQRRNSANYLDGARADNTEESILVEALELLFRQPGLNSECLEYAFERMKILYR